MTQELNWIDAAERLPDHEEEFIVALRGPGRTDVVSVLEFIRGTWCCSAFSPEVSDKIEQSLVKYWSPLPKWPKGV